MRNVTYTYYIDFKKMEFFNLPIILDYSLSYSFPNTHT